MTVAELVVALGKCAPTSRVFFDDDNYDKPSWIDMYPEILTVQVENDGVYLSDTEPVATTTKIPTPIVVASKR